MSVTSVIPITVVGPASVGTVAWRARGACYLTVVVKGTFALVPDARMTPVEPDPIFALEQANAEGIGLRTPGDLAPHLGAADVWLVGHAAAPPGVVGPSISVRLLVVQGGVVQIQKELVLNIGQGTARGATVPIAGAGPISASWPLRARWLEGGGAPRQTGRMLDIPEGLRWEYFQTAPLDQRVAGIRGDEVVMLDGMVAGFPRLSTTFPAARGVARIYRRSAAVPRQGERLSLWPDTLQIDVDTLRCSILWRGRLAISGEEDLGALRLVAGLELPGKAVSFRDPFEGTAEASAVKAPNARGGKAYDETAALGAEDLEEIAKRLSLPFGTELAGVSAPDGAASRPAPPRSAPSLTGGETMAFDDNVLKRLEEFGPLPFDSPGSASAPLRNVPVQTAPSSSEDTAPIVPRGEAPFSGTSALTLDDLQRIAELTATPFSPDQASAVKEPDAAVLPLVMPSPAAVLGEARFSGTGMLSFEDIEKISQLAPTPFEARPERGGTEGLGALDPDGLGAEFLAAMAEARALQ